jgi:hypothetical protein
MPYGNAAALRVRVGGILRDCTIRTSRKSCDRMYDGRSGPASFVRIASESAIIIWDPATHIEHFIRTASFDPSPPQQTGAPKAPLERT